MTDGLLLVDKPPGPTSHDIVAGIRRGCRLRRVGHAGTLDPAATGLLPIVVGRATRLVRFLPAAPKVYVGTLRLGRTTTTDDDTGECIESHGGPLPPARQVLRSAASLEGPGTQVPPAYSARRVGGRRLYELARKGVAVEAAATPVEIHRFELHPTPAPDVYAFTAEVSSGTYIRSLARDLGRKLGCGGVLATLRRTGIGPLRIEDSTPYPDSPDRAWLARGLIPLDRMPLRVPAARLPDEDSCRRFRLGAAVPCPRGVPADAESLSVADPAGALLGIAVVEGDRLQPRVVIPPAATDSDPPPG